VIIDGDFFVNGVFDVRRAAARAVVRFVVFRFVVLRFAGARFALDRFVAVRRVDLFTLVRALVRFADDRFDMMNFDC
jgi:hypothetical protein